MSIFTLQNLRGETPSSFPRQPPPVPPFQLHLLLLYLQLFHYSVPEINLFARQVNAIDRLLFINNVGLGSPRPRPTDCGCDLCYFSLHSAVQWKQLEHVQP